ncbi:MAG: N-acetyltransferase [Flavobacteriales bacterium]|nr:MAG: N-acetyltransferase [Flavobacteriales bacterium]
MSSAPHIRPATEADLPAILAITNEVIANTTAIYAFQPQRLEERARWFNDLKAGGWPVIVAVEAGQVTGFGSIGVFRARPGYKYTGEHSVHVHAGHRGKGVGRALLQALIAEAERMELRTIVGGIDAENAMSLKLHDDLGFIETARMPQVAWKFGRWLTLVFMQLTLAGPRTPREGNDR